MRLPVIGEPSLHVIDVLREVLRFGRGSGERLRGHPVRAGCAAEAQIDAATVDVRERSVLFGDHERSVVGQHDTAGSDPDLLRHRGGP